jgi:hypothetical protein
LRQRIKGFLAGGILADEADGLAGIRANAELVVEQFGGVSGLDHFGYDAPSVQWVEGFIERQRVRADVDPRFVDQMVSVLGSYLGECIIRTYGGQWSLGEEGWRVEFDPKNAAFPFAKVEKQFANGAEDGISSFFTAIPLIIPSLREPGTWDAPTLPRSGAAKKPSWLRRLFRGGDRP